MDCSSTDRAAQPAESDPELASVKLDTIHPTRISRGRTPNGPAHGYGTQDYEVRVDTQRTGGGKAHGLAKAPPPEAESVAANVEEAVMETASRDTLRKLTGFPPAVADTQTATASAAPVPRAPLIRIGPPGKRSGAVRWLDRPERMAKDMPQVVNELLRPGAMDKKGRPESHPRLLLPGRGYTGIPPAVAPGRMWNLRASVAPVPLSPPFTPATEGTERLVAVTNRTRREWADDACEGLKIGSHPAEKGGLSTFSGCHQGAALATRSPTTFSR